jgi:hypothetical protein
LPRFKGDFSMTQSPAETTPMPEQNQQPEIKAVTPQTDAEKKAEADKAALQATA